MCSVAVQCCGWVIILSPITNAAFSNQELIFILTLMLAQPYLMRKSDMIDEG